MSRRTLLAWALMLAACGGADRGRSAPVPAPTVVTPDARGVTPVPDATSRAVVDAAPTRPPRPAAEQLRDEAMGHGHAWIRETYGPPSVEQISACEAACAEQSRVANSEASSKDRRRELGCARVSCEGDCAISAVADFRCH